MLFRSKVGSWKNNKNIIRNTARLRKGDTYGNKLINWIVVLKKYALLIMFPIALINLVMKEQFSGVRTDDAAAHLNNFVELCEMQKYKDVDGDIIKLKAGQQK